MATATVTQSDLSELVSDFLRESDAEKRLYEAIGKLPSKRLIVHRNGETLLIEQHYYEGKVVVRRGMTVLED